MLRSSDSVEEMGSAEALLICHDVDRTELLEGRAYSRIMDSVAGRLASLGWESVQFALPFSSLTRDRAWGRPASANRSYLARTIAERLGRLMGNTVPGQALRGFGSREKLYARVLSRSQARVVMAIGCPEELCRAARSVGVPLVEVLHGIAYHEIPWGWEDRDDAALPHAVLSFDPVSTATFRTLEPRGVKVFETPNPWMEQFLDPRRRDSLPPEWGQRPDWIPRDGPVVLVTLMWGYAGDHGPYDQYENVLANGLFPEAVAHAIRDSRDTVHWLLRLHPVQLHSGQHPYVGQRRFLTRFCEGHPNCQWVRPSTAPLPVILPHVSGHLTMSSMAAYDCAYFGVPTLLLCPTVRPGAIHEERFADLKEHGLATLGDWDRTALREWAEASRKTSPFTTAATTAVAGWDGLLEWARETADAESRPPHPS